MAEKIERGPVTTKTGHVLTETDFEQIASDAEAGVDLGRISNVRLGRPSLSGQPKHSPRIQFRTTDEQVSLAEAVAAREGVTLSTLARHAFEEYLDRRAS